MSSRCFGQFSHVQSFDDELWYSSESNLKATNLFSYEVCSQSQIGSHAIIVTVCSYPYKFCNRSFNSIFT